MSGKTLEFSLDGENCISVTLSDSGRISLSDIAAATIGNLEDSCWDEIKPDNNIVTSSGGTLPVPAITTGIIPVPAITIAPLNSNSWEPHTANQSTVSTQSVSVLRPWESIPVVTNTDSLSASAGAYDSLPDLKPPPSYQEHLKRQYDSEDNKENHNSKRLKISEQQSKLSQQISSFYQHAKSSPVTNQFTYPSLRNFIKQEPILNIQTPTKPTGRSQMAAIHQPWAITGESSDFTFNSSNTLVRPAEQRQPVFTNTNTTLDYSDKPPVYLPVTPTGKVSNSYSHQHTSPVMDSRLDDSLGLLGSPQMNSPLTKHPYFSDLQALLSNECKREKVPQSLFSVQEKQTSPKKQQENVFTREQKLQERFEKLQSGHAEEVRQMSSFFRYQTALIETERFKTLHECKYPGSYKESINVHFDNKLRQIMDRVEQSVLLMEKSDLEAKAARVPKPRPHFRKEAIDVMEEWYSQNLDHPYPTATTVEYLARVGNVGVEQVKKWFANKRNRSQNTRTLTEIAMKKRKLGQLSSN